MTFDFDIGDETNVRYVGGVIQVVVVDVYDH